MQLVGQYDSPFVRRVAVALNHYQIPFERKILSVFTDFESMLEVNPLGKVPSLILPNDEVLFDSRMIIDYLDSIASSDLKLIPTDSDKRRQMLKTEAVALGLAEKCYERGIEFARRQKDKIDYDWADRLEKQILSALAWLEIRAGNRWLHGHQMGLADITLTVAMTFLREKKQIDFDEEHFPNLVAHCNSCESLSIFSQAAYSADEAHQSGWRPRI